MERSNSPSQDNHGVNAPSHNEGSFAEVPTKEVILKAKVRMMMNRLFNVYLTLLEDVVDDHDDAMGKLIDALPDEHKKLVILADYLPEHRVKAFRKRVLDVGNAGLKELESEIENLEI